MENGDTANFKRIFDALHPQLVEFADEYADIHVRRSGSNIINLLIRKRWMRNKILQAVGNIISKKGINVEGLVKILELSHRQNAKYETSDAAIQHRSLLMQALYSTIVKKIEDGSISVDVVIKIISDRLNVDFVNGTIEPKKDYFNRFGRNPPGFVLLSPSQFCNLKCTGCYSDSDKTSKSHLSYEIVNRIINETRELWGARSVAISGGEPFLYSDKGKRLIDLIEENSQTYFKIYTNGLAINKDLAQRLAKAGNASPAISIEGTEQQTDARRGEGVYKRVMMAMEHLRCAGVPYGVSITATRDNIDTLMQESFYDNLFDVMGITYGWIFEYMPVGRGADVDMMPSPEQRKSLFQLLDDQNHRGRFICDFWSTSPSAEGCIAAGRSNGYLYIDWNGDIVPCVFNPYSDNNILKVYNEGGSINDAINGRLLTAIREWQRGYGFQQGNASDNYMIPCPIRDHFEEYIEILRDTEAKPINESAMIALSDESYHERMIEYGREIRTKLDPVWKERFCKKGCECKQ